VLTARSVGTKGGYGPLFSCLFSPQKFDLSPHLHLSPPVRVSRAFQKPRRKGSSGASLDDVPLASGQARQRLTSSVACEESAHLSFVQNEPLECTLSVSRNVN
jgi:hypothetical protein